MKNILILILCLFLFCCGTTVFATDQEPDYIYIENPEDLISSYQFEELPLREYLENKQIEFDVSSTANWDGYVAMWEIKDKQLFLISLYGQIKGKDVSAGKIFGFNKRYPIKADWYTGKVTVLIKEPIDNCIFPKLRIFSIKDGNIIDIQDKINVRRCLRVIDNGYDWNKAPIEQKDLLVEVLVSKENMSRSNLKIIQSLNEYYSPLRGESFLKDTIEMAVKLMSVEEEE